MIYNDHPHAMREMYATAGSRQSVFNKSQTSALRSAASYNFGALSEGGFSDGRWVGAGSKCRQASRARPSRARYCMKAFGAVALKFRALGAMLEGCRGVSGQE